jgi:hypothetical protein
LALAVKGSGVRIPSAPRDSCRLTAEARGAWATVSDVHFTTHVYVGEDSPNALVGDFLAAYAAVYPDEAPSAFAAIGLLAAAIDDAGEATHQLAWRRTWPGCRAANANRVAPSGV